MKHCTECGWIGESDSVHCCKCGQKHCVFPLRETITLSEILTPEACSEITERDNPLKKTPAMLEEWLNPTHSIFGECVIKPALCVFCGVPVTDQWPLFTRKHGSDTISTIHAGCVDPYVEANGDIYLPGDDHLRRVNMKHSVLQYHARLQPNAKSPSCGQLTRIDVSAFSQHQYFAPLLPITIPEPDEDEDDETDDPIIVDSTVPGGTVEN